MTESLFLSQLQIPLTSSSFPALLSPVLPLSQFRRMPDVHDSENVLLLLLVGSWAVPGATGFIIPQGGSA